MIPITQTTSRRLFLGLVSLFLPIAGLAPASAASTPQVISLTWDDPNPESDVIGYKVHLGTQSGAYTQSMDTGNSSEVAFANLVPGQKYYCVVTAYNSSGVESSYSEEIAFIAIASDTTFNVSNLKVDKQQGASTPSEVSMTVEGQLGTGTEIHLEASNDLVTWELISSHPNESGSITINDPGANGQAKRFYRFVEN